MVPVSGSTPSSAKSSRPSCGKSFLVAERQLERDRRGPERGQLVLLPEPGEVQHLALAEGEIDVDRVGALDRRQQGRPGLHQVADVHQAAADPAADRRDDLGVGDVQLGGGDGGPGILDARLGQGDRRLEIDLGLLQVGLPGLHHGLGRLVVRRLAIVLLAGLRAALHQAAPADLVELGDERVGLGDEQGRPGDLDSLGPPGRLEVRLGLGQLRLGRLERRLERLLVDDEEQLSLLDGRAVLEVDAPQVAVDAGPEVDPGPRLRRAGQFHVVGHGTPDRVRHRHGRRGGGAY